MKLPEILFANLPLKVLSLFFATVLWLFVSLETTDETDLPLAIKYVNVPPGLTLQGGATKPPVLRIAGPRTLLIRQQWQGVRVVELDLSGARAGRLTFTGLERHVGLIPGVRPVRVSPVNLEIFLAAR
jgi:hypothetical protein